MRRQKKEKMQFRFYAIPIAGDKTVEDELNAFVRSHKIVAIDKQFSDKDSAWVFCITYIENSVATSGSFQSKKEKIDYKEVLDEQTFARFSKLREARKQIADEEAIPAYLVFTNEELAEISAIENLVEGNIAGIKGIGQKRAEKYERRLLELSNKL